MGTILEVKNLKKYYQIGETTTRAVDGVSFLVEEGDFISIMGPSGSGKSTLLYMLGLLEDPTEGEIILENEKVHNLKDTKSSAIRRNKIGFVFQFYNLIPNLSVLDNVLAPVLLEKKNVKEYTESAKRILEMVGLKNMEKVEATLLSGGQQQRVAIARALVNNPKYILADEPIGSLDIKTGKEIMELFKKLNRKGTTIIQVTHNEESSKYGNRVIRIVDGKIHAKKEGT